MTGHARTGYNILVARLFRYEFADEAWPPLLCRQQVVSRRRTGLKTAGISWIASASASWEMARISLLYRPRS
jgi:hypothetical protein